MRVGSEKHENSTFNCLVQTEYKFAKVFVALVKIFVVKIKLELVALVIITYYGCKHLTLSNKVFADQLNSEIGVKIVLENFHWRESSTCQNNSTWFLIDQQLFENVSRVEAMHAEVSDVLLT